ncbi:magnesium transporter [Cyathus striatus]|nr:magnesium transporter [Cyathus striatus]
MPRENSFSDSEGRSLTPDLSEEEHDQFQAVQQSSQVPPTSPASPTGEHLHGLALITSRLSKHSARTGKSNIGTAPSPVHVIPGWKTLTPKDRFKAAVRRVMTMRKGTSVLTGGGRVGAEPGVDPRRASADLTYGHIKQDCVIEIVDYSTLRTSFGRMTNKEFVSFMGDPEASRRDPWVKVRWINIGGMSWDVIKAVSIKYDLHPLALEDVFHGHTQTRSKADYYSRHLFLRVLCHELGEEDELLHPSQTAAYGSTLTAEPDVMEEEEEEENEKIMDEERTAYGSTPNPKSSPSRNMRRRPILPTTRNDILGKSNTSNSRLAGLMKNELAAKSTEEKLKEQEVSVEALKKGERVNVKVSPMFIFLFRNGTVISFYPSPNLEFSAPISARLRQTDTVLRKSADGSLLVQALLDLVVDRAMQVIEQYHQKINKFERRILLRPNMKTVRNLHILSGDLILHKRTMEPIKTLLYGLRRYDVDRCAALIDTSDPANAEVKVVGFMSHKAKIYLADVYDHMEYILTSLDMFADITQNLIDYTFNIASYEMNEVMRRLTLATIIFLPLTLLTGYFGMNFENMWSVRHSDVLFWEIALPVMAFVIPVFLWPDLQRMYHYIQKRLTSKRAVKSYKQA